MSLPAAPPRVAADSAMRRIADWGAPAMRSSLLGFALAAACLAPALAQKTGPEKTGAEKTPAAGEKAQTTAVLPGGNSKEPINIDAAKLDYFDKEQKLVYTGNVVATQGPSKMTATVLVLFLTPKASADQSGVPSSSSQLQRMEATGPVTVISKDQVGTGDSGVYEKSENKVYLIGNVTLTQGPNVTKGDKLTYDLTTSQAVVTGRVKSMFIPSGGAKAADAPEADAAGHSKKPAKKQ